MKQRYINAVTGRNLVKVRIMLADELLLDPRGNTFKEMLAYAKQNLPNARILFVVNDELNEYLTQDLITICEATDVEYLHLQNISRMDYHPDVDGMKEIYRQIYNYFKNNK